MTDTPRQTRDEERGYSFSPRERMAVLAASTLGSSMAFINGTAVTLALDPIQASLGASLGSMLWVASIYMLFLASLMLIGGALGDFSGRRAVFAWGVALFSASSLACALAPDEGWLIAARAGQGIGAALLTPMSLTLIADAFDEEHRGSAIGLWSSASALMTAAGPPLGGWIAEHLSWRGIFYINLPLGIAALLITLFLTRPKPPRRKPEHIDWQGALLAVTSCAGISYGLIALSESPDKSLFAASAWHWGLPILAGIIAVGVLIRVERRAKSPMAPPELFTSDVFNAVNMVTMLIYGAMGGIFVFYPIVLKDAWGHGVDETGIAFLGFAVPMAVITMLAGYLMRRFGVRLMLASGSLISAFAFASMALFPWSGTLWGAFFSMLIFGIGMALLAPAMTTAIFNATPDESHGAASGINNALARAATLFAITGFGTIAAFAFDSVAGPAAEFAGFGNGEILTGNDLANYRDAMIASLQALVWVSITLALCAAFVAAWFMSGDIEKGEIKAEARHQVFGFLRMFETAPTREGDIYELADEDHQNECNPDEAER